MKPGNKIRKKLFWIRIRMEITWMWRGMWRGILCFFGRFRKPREIVWEESCSGMVPTCPRCHDIVFYQDKCWFCGQRFLPGAQTVGRVLDNAE